MSVSRACQRDSLRDLLRRKKVNWQAVECDAMLSSASILCSKSDKRDTRSASDN